jgi:hypothetical protein
VGRRSRPLKSAAPPNYRMRPLKPDVPVRRVKSATCFSTPALKKCVTTGKSGMRQCLLPPA